MKQKEFTYSQEEAEAIIRECYSKSDLMRALGFQVNGTGGRRATEFIKKYNLSIDHFDLGYSKRDMYPRIKKMCPVCGKEFVAVVGGSKPQKVTCSYSCSNTYFRSGKNNPNWKDVSDKYRAQCIHYHGSQCIICGEEIAMVVHHIDENRNNNAITNLIPLCWNHHWYWHKGYKHLIEDKVTNYMSNYIKQQQWK